MTSSPKSVPQAPGSPVDWNQFAAVIEKARRIVLTSHLRPDSDALGSELGMAAILESLGKQVRIVNPQATPPNLRFLDPAGRIHVVNRAVKPADLAEFDLLLVLDTSAWAQLGEMGDVIRGFTGKVAVLDHHQSSDDLGAQMFRDTTAEATGRLVVDAAARLGVTLTAEMARPLFAAVATDTGWFRFSSTQPDTYRCAAALVEAGARPDQIYASLYEHDSLARLKLIGRTLASTTVELEGRLIHTAIVSEDFLATGALPSDTEDIINMTLGVAGTQVAVIFVEQANGSFKVSLRSRCAVDCSRIAAQFGGGGHKAAAGATVAGPLEAARSLVLDAVRAAMR